MLTSPVSLHSLGELGFTHMLLDNRQKRSVRHVQNRCSGEDGGIFQHSYCNINCCCLAPCISTAGLCGASLGDFPILETGHPKSNPRSFKHNPFVYQKILWRMSSSSTLREHFGRRIKQIEMLNGSLLRDTAYIM